jgi:hypothetical protein
MMRDMVQRHPFSHLNNAVAGAKSPPEELIALQTSSINQRGMKPSLSALQGPGKERNNRT